MKKKEESLLKVYFVAPLFAKSKLSDFYQLIAKALRNNGCVVWDDVNKISHKDAQSFTEKQMKEYFNKVRERIQNCDIFVSEGSYTSSSVGYEICYAETHFKPVLILREESFDDSKPGAPFRARASKTFKVTYYNKNNVDKVIKKYISKFKEGFFVKRLPIEFTANQIEKVEKIKQKKQLRSFNASVRYIIDNSELK